MLGIAISLPPEIVHYLSVTSFPLLAAQALLFVGWIPIFGVIIWGLTHIWMDFKQGKYNANLKYQLLEIRVPQGSINTPKGMENFFMNLAGTKSAITWRETWLIGKFQPQYSFEIVGSEGNVRFYIRAIDKYRDLVEAALYAQYPEAQITEVEDYSTVVPREYPHEEYDLFGSEMVLSNKSYFPIRTYKEFEHQGEKDFRFKDPLLPIIELMGKMREKEHFWIQFIITPPDKQTLAKEGAEYLNAMMGKEKKKAPSLFEGLAEGVLWFPKGIITQVTGMEFSGKSVEDKKDDFRMFRMTGQERLMMDAVAEKISKTTYKTKIRWIYAGPRKTFRKGMMAGSAKGLFGAFSHQYLNGFSLHVPATPRDDYIWQAWSMAKKQRILINRYQKRIGGEGASWQILNVEELATLFHFPAADARTPVLSNVTARRAEAPEELSFAKSGEADLPSWKQTVEDAKQENQASQIVDQPLVVPTPVAPTIDHASTPSHLSRSGEDVPPNLPV